MKEHRKINSKKEINKGRKSMKKIEVRRYLIKL